MAYNGGIVDQETNHLTYHISGTATTATFDVMAIKSHDLILGFPWLQENNPDIDWEQGLLRWRHIASSSDDEGVEDNGNSPLEQE